MWCELPWFQSGRSPLRFWTGKGKTSWIPVFAVLQTTQRKGCQPALSLPLQVYCETFPVSNTVTGNFSSKENIYFLALVLLQHFILAKKFRMGFLLISYCWWKLFPSVTLRDFEFLHSALIPILFFPLILPGVTQNSAVFTIMCWSFSSPSDEILLIIHTNIINHLCFCRRIYHTVLPETPLFRRPVCHTQTPVAELNQKTCFCQSDLRR